MMEESILNSIKKLLMVSADDTNFDLDIITHINTVFVVLNQLGVGPEGGFAISDDLTTWGDYLGDDVLKFNLIKSYIVLKVRMLFDPPQSGTLSSSINEQIREFEFRIIVTTTK